MLGSLCFGITGVLGAIVHAAKVSPMYALTDAFGAPWVVGPIFFTLASALALRWAHTRPGAAINREEDKEIWIGLVSGYIAGAYLADFGGRWSLMVAMGFCSFGFFLVFQVI